ncbi:hypothetical protein RUM44_005634 [Polyplax serrata]|uniref:Ribosomal protein L1 n=1 Tax=Polyplax serrata TaxID=468196 RepID=A0ABR1ADZ1_POLSC
MKDLNKDIKNSLDVLLKLENAKSNKNDLFGKEKSVCLRISLFRIPKVYRIKRKYLKLRHSRFGSDPEICLFVPNRRDKFDYKISVDESIEITIDYYTNFLRKHKVEGIKTIMPIKQLKSEYSPYELRRKLVNRFDLFLCKTSLLYNPKFISALGKEPLGVSFPSVEAPYDPSLNKNIKKLLMSTTFKIKPFSDNYAVPFGTLSQSSSELMDNLKTVIKQIMEGDAIPGGFQNVRAMYLGTSTVGAVPLYICEDVPQNMKTPRLKSRRKGMRTVEGEITTLPGKKVMVKRTGEVIIEKLMTNNSNQKRELEESSDEESDIDEGSDTEELFPASKTEDDDDDDVAFKAKISENDNSESDEDDEEIEKRERRLLEESNRIKGQDEDQADDDESESEAPPKKQRKLDKSASKGGKSQKKLQRLQSEAKKNQSKLDKKVKIKSPKVVSGKEKGSAEKVTKPKRLKINIKNKTNKKGVSEKGKKSATIPKMSPKAKAKVNRNRTK